MVVIFTLIYLLNNQIPFWETVVRATLETHQRILENCSKKVCAGIG